LARFDAFVESLSTMADVDLIETAATD
jgi:hypothetical protein